MHQRKRRTVGIRSKYAKIPIKTKIKFLKKVIQEGFSIRDVPFSWSSLLPSSTLITQLQKHSFDSISPTVLTTTSTFPQKKQTFFTKIKNVCNDVATRFFPWILTKKSIILQLPHLLFLSQIILCKKQIQIKWIKFWKLPKVSLIEQLKLSVHSISFEKILSQFYL